MIDQEAVDRALAVCGDIRRVLLRLRLALAQDRLRARRDLEHDLAARDAGL